MSKFAKVFDIEDGGQVLVTMNAQDDDTFGLVLRTDMHGVEMQITARFEKEEECRYTFDKFSIIQAESFKQDMQKTYGQA